MKRLCVDFDDTIYDGKAILPGCITALTRLRHSGYSIAIFSARATDAERSQMVTLLNQFSVPYDEILDRKPDAIAFIDDKGFKFESWDKVPLAF